MKKIKLLVLLTICGPLILPAQPDTALARRLGDVLHFTQIMDMDKIMDYTYPKLFTIVTREQLIEALKGSFDNQEFSTTLDSLKVDTVFPVFTVQDDSYSKIKHSMIMRMKFKEAVDSAGDIEDRELMAAMMEEQFGKGNARYDHKNDHLVIKIRSNLVAIKNKKDGIWYFVNLDEENKVMIDRLFSKEVQGKLKEYK